jgi:hypothetical protein
MATNYSPKIATDGLVLCLDAANTKSYPGTGTTWTDLSGNGNDATMINSPVYSSENSGYFVFDGVNDYGTVSGAAPGTNDFTWNIWFTVDNNVQNRYLFDFGSNGGTLSYGTSVSGYGVRYYTPAMGTGSAVYTGGPVPDVGVWYNIAVTRASGTVTMYANGDFQVSSPGDTHNISGTLSLGRYGSSLQYNHDGSYASISMYSRALTAAEISQNFQALRGRYGV